MKFVERNAQVGFGQPVIIGRRLTVFTVVTNANNVGRIEDFLVDFELSEEELKSAVEYCKNRVCNDISLPTDRYCDGCVLRSIGDGWTSIKDDYIEIDGMAVAKDGMTGALMSLDELEESEFGILGWVIAEEVHRKLLGINDK